MVLKIWVLIKKKKSFALYAQNTHIKINDRKINGLVVLFHIPKTEEKNICQLQSF